MKHWRQWFLVVVVVVSAVGAEPALAQDAQQERGLFITPPRQYESVSAAGTTSGELTVGNANDTAMVVTLSVEQFTVADHTYDYLFKVPKDNWVTLSAKRLELGAKESRKVSYKISPPANAQPGGHYFSIFASASLSTGRQIRTTMVLYLTVEGDLRRTSEVTGDTIPAIWLGGNLPLKFDIKNTGNTHFFIYTSTTLSGWYTHYSTVEVAHILLPQTTRSIEAVMQPPFLPGLYTINYNHRSEDGRDSNKTKQLVYLPLWFFAFIAGVVWLTILLIRRKHRAR